MENNSSYIEKVPTFCWVVVVQDAQQQRLCTQEALILQMKQELLRASMTKDELNSKNVQYNSIFLVVFYRINSKSCLQECWALCIIDVLCTVPHPWKCVAGRATVEAGGMQQAVG